MDAQRANIVRNIQKTVGDLGANLKRAAGIPVENAGNGQRAANSPNSIGQPIQGSGFVRILMYILAGLLMIGIILIGIDQWITPVFQRSPGSPGYIPIPGTDTTQAYWLTNSDVKDIIVGTPPPSPAGMAVPPSVSVIEAQTSYSITMDILIVNEYPQDLGPRQTRRILFVMSQAVNNPSLQVSLDNDKNTISITCIDSDGWEQSIKIDNVPIHVPFRIGITVSPFALEGYLNGLLVKTRQLNTTPKPPTAGDKIFSPANIISNGKVMSAGVRVLNIRCFGYVAPATEMKGRMGDLSDISAYGLK